MNEGKASARRLLLPFSEDTAQPREDSGRRDSTENERIGGSSGSKTETVATLQFTERGN